MQKPFCQKDNVFLVVLEEGGRDSCGQGFPIENSGDKNLISLVGVLAPHQELLTLFLSL